MKKFPILLVCMTLLALVVSACGTTQGGTGVLVESTTQAPPEESATIDPPSSAGEPPALTAHPTTDEVSISTPTAPEPVAPTEAQPVKTELEASDPTRVSLASGQVHLVEFFAFW